MSLINLTPKEKADLLFSVVNAEIPNKKMIKDHISTKKICMIIIGEVLICIIGTESTGKTVLSQILAKHFNTSLCPELGREIVQNSEKTTIEDIKKIGIEHAKHILKHTREANKILIIDTNLAITKSYSKFLFGEIPVFDSWIEEANKCDLYIYLEPTAPYVDDGTRFDFETRNKLVKSHLEIFKQEGITFKSFSFNQNVSTKYAYYTRLNEIINYINYFIKQY